MSEKLLKELVPVEVKVERYFGECKEIEKSFEALKLKWKIQRECEKVITQLEVSYAHLNSGACRVMCPCVRREKGFVSS